MKRIIQPGEKHAAVTVYVFTEETPRRVLLVHHKKFDRWVPPGGHVEWNENPYEAVIREAKEETGFDVAPYLPLPAVADEYASLLPEPKFLAEERVEAYGDQPAHFHIDHVYATTAPYADVAHDGAESHGIGWFTYEETQDLKTFEIVHLILKRLFLA